VNAALAYEPADSAFVADVFAALNDPLAYELAELAKLNAESTNSE
jgi:hypothetical protein